MKDEISVFRGAERKWMRASWWLESDLAMMLSADR